MEGFEKQKCGKKWHKNSKHTAGFLGCFFSMCDFTSCRCSNCYKCHNIQPCLFWFLFFSFFFLFFFLFLGGGGFDLLGGGGVGGLFWVCFLFFYFIFLGFFLGGEGLWFVLLIWKHYVYSVDLKSLAWKFSICVEYHWRAYTSKRNTFSSEIHLYLSESLNSLANSFCSHVISVEVPMTT